MVVIFWDLLIIFQNFLSPQVKQNVIIISKYGIYDLPHELSNDLCLGILKNEEIYQENLKAP